MPTNANMQQLRGTAAQWAAASTRIPAVGQICFEMSTDTPPKVLRMKVGNGVQNFANLPDGPGGLDGQITVGLEADILARTPAFVPKAGEFVFYFKNPLALAARRGDGTTAFSALTEVSTTTGSLTTINNQIAAINAQITAFGDVVNEATIMEVLADLIDGNVGDPLVLGADGILAASGGLTITPAAEDLVTNILYTGPLSQYNREIGLGPVVDAAALAFMETPLVISAASGLLTIPNSTPGAPNIPLYFQTSLSANATYRFAAPLSLMAPRVRHGFVDIVNPTSSSITISPAIVTAGYLKVVGRGSVSSSFTIPGQARALVYYRYVPANGQVGAYFEVEPVVGVTAAGAIEMVSAALMRTGTSALPTLSGTAGVGLAPTGTRKHLLIAAAYRANAVPPTFDSANGWTAIHAWNSTTLSLAIGAKFIAADNEAYPAVTNGERHWAALINLTNAPALVTDAIGITAIGNINGSGILSGTMKSDAGVESAMPNPGGLDATMALWPEILLSPGDAVFGGAYVNSGIDISMIGHSKMVNALESYSTTGATRTYAGYTGPISSFGQEIDVLPAGTTKITFAVQIKAN